MVIKSASKIFAAALLLLLLANQVWAQEGGYYLEIKPRFVQRLTWTGSEHVLRYEVIIEQEEDGVYSRALQGFTEQPFIEVSLQPGNYRYRVIPYDLFNRPAQGSNWDTFSILPAIIPELTDFSPHTFIPDPDRTGYVLYVSGNNLVPGAEIILRLPGSNQVIVPAETEVVQDGTGARLIFNREQLIPGVYLIQLKNPGGLEASIWGFTIERYEPPALTAVTEKPVQTDGENQDSLDFYLGAAWIPLLQIYGADYRFTNPNIYPIGAALRFGMVYSTQSLPNIGLELSASWYSENTLLAENNILLRIPFFNRSMAVTFRAGAGLILPLGGKQFDSMEAIGPLNRRSVFANGGVSFLWLPLRHLYLETGINYSHIFSVDRHSGCLRPWVGAGAVF